MSEINPFPDGELPVHESISVKEYVTIYKTAKWWKVVALVNQFGHDRVVAYQWIMDEKKGKWKRKQKMAVLSEKEWEQIKSSMEKLVPKITRVR